MTKTKYVCFQTLNKALLINNPIFMTALPLLAIKSNVSFVYQGSNTKNCIIAIDD